MPINHTADKANAPRPDHAERYGAIRAELNALLALPGRGDINPHRRRRDELILQAIAADLHARMIDARHTSRARS